MDRVLFVVASGGKQLMQAQTLNSHNLANANTVGFQQDLANFSAKMINGPGFQTRAFASAEAGGFTFEKGEMQSTGRQMDVAVNGDGWIAVQAPDGSEAFTRSGNLKVNINGQLMTGANHPVLGENGPIVVPEFESLEVGVDGTISVLPIGQQASSLAEVGRIKLVSPDPETLEKGADGLLRPKDGQEVEASTDITLTNGVLESSNVSIIDAMVNMISLARQFEMSVKVMQTAQEMDEKTTQIMKLG